MPGQAHGADQTEFEQYNYEVEGDEIMASWLGSTAKAEYIHRCLQVPKFVSL